MTKVDVVTFLEELGVANVHVRGDEAYYSCPFDGHSNADKTPSASMNVDTGGWFCFGCGRRGNPTAFLAQLEGVSPIRAGRWIKERFGSGVTRQAPESVEQRIARELEGSPLKMKPPIPFVSEAELESRMVDWARVKSALDNGADVHPSLSYMLARLPADVLDEWEFGIDHVSGMVCFPYRHHEDGRLIGFKGRAWWPDAQPRYRVLGNKFGAEGGEFTFPTLDVSRVVFGGHMPIDRMRPLAVVEGELNAIAVRSYGYQAVGLSGRFMSKEQRNIVASLTDHAVVIYDDRADALAAGRELVGSISVSIFPDHDEDPLELGEKRFRELYVGSRSWIDVSLS